MEDKVTNPSLAYLVWCLAQQDIPDTPENREAVKIAMDAIERAVKAGAIPSEFDLTIKK